MQPAEGYEEIRSGIRALCTAFPDEYFRKLDAVRGYPDEFIAALTKAGSLAALIPTEYGGSGLSLTEVSVIMEEINRSGETRLYQVAPISTNLIFSYIAERVLGLPRPTERSRPPQPAHPCGDQAMSIEYETQDHVARITINRPQAMNAIDRAHNGALEEAWRRLNEDPQIRVGVLTGAGERAFCAGADLKELIPSHHRAVRAGERTPWAMGGITLEPHYGKPMIAAVNGHALAGGMELALACDIRLCSPNATFGLAETKWALIPGAGGTQRLPRMVPLGWAMEMILSGEPIDAPTALNIGLVNRVVPNEQLLASAMRLAATIAERGPLAVKAARRAILEGLTLGLAAGLSNERDLFIEIMKTDDALEGATAFAEKRAPRFKGR